ncbi:MAG: NnrS family protein [Mangrovicoccus sp.]|nr:NnrS family protein [Mangrovicoccus sp.]
MTTATTNPPQLRPRFFSAGFRPFFFSAAIWAVLSMALWLALLSGDLSLPGQGDIFAWHAHELLFGYLAAPLAGFLLTAVPSWTGQSPLQGRALIGLFALWILARLAMLFLGVIPAVILAPITLAMPLALALFVGFQIGAGRNWRNLSVLATVLLVILGQGLFHIELAQNGSPAQGAGLRLGLMGTLMMIALVGGRLAANFSRNWLKSHGETKLPADLNKGDMIALALLAAALLLWVIWPDGMVTALALLLGGLGQLWRLSRWRGLAVRAEPLLFVLHGAFVFVPLGALAMAFGIAAPGLMPQAAAQHLWMVGAMGLMTLAVMTRATLGHSGGSLHAGPGTVAIFVAIVLAAALRPLAGLWLDMSGLLYALSALAWIAGFGLFLICYGPRLLGRVGG